ncbi:MAG TPA: hypothetical protein VHU82_03140 [Vicinamibacterales bacterium]|jgi:hypothetical protein|nr:hypothetical protein [Vicinamibacterales bacterium]
MKRLILSAAFVALGVGLIAQTQHPAGHDPDKMAAGGGTLPAGWSARLDNGSTKPDGVSFAPMGTGLHVKSGPAGIYFRPVDKSSTVSAAFTQMEPSAHPEAYGVFIGGSDLQGPNQKYTYFVIRQDGKFLIKRRAGTETPSVMNWTDNAAIKRADSSGKMTNTLAIQTDKEKAHFLVNGTEVAAVPVAEIDVNGVAGLRVNHNLNVHIEGFTTKGGKTASEK